jgi:hypothetical protein
MKNPSTVAAFRRLLILVSLSIMTADPPDEA